MTIDPRAGQLPGPADLTNVPRLVTAYYSLEPDPAVPAQRVAFGTSGHRGSAFDLSFNETHILAITEAICRHRRSKGIDGPLFLGIDTHALSEPAATTALEVLAANDVTVMIDARGGYTPTPAVSRAIVRYNRGRSTGLADGIVVTPSHNPPPDGGFKYDPPHGGAADSATTGWIQDEANRLIAARLEGVRRVPFDRARKAATTRRHDFREEYVADLPTVISFDPIRAAGLELAVDPLGGAGLDYWARIAEAHRFNLTVVSTEVDPTFRFMHLDWDGKIRMDPSSRYAMGRLASIADRFDVAWACDTDHDRHGIVTPRHGLLDPNAYLAVAVDYLATHRPGWPAAAAVGKTVVTSSLVDRAAAARGRAVLEVPVGFKWFVEGLADATLGFAGEESAGATFIAADGSPWTTDKDGLIMGLLAAEITAATGRNPGERYADLTRALGTFAYERQDSPATPEEKAALGRITAEQVAARTLAGAPIETILTQAPGNGAPIGGIKVVSKEGWFAARPSGTEDIYKLYAESYRDRAHLAQIQTEARAIVLAALGEGKRR